MFSSLFASLAKPAPADKVGAKLLHLPLLALSKRNTGSRCETFAEEVALP